MRFLCGIVVCCALPHEGAKKSEYPFLSIAHESKLNVRGKVDWKERRMLLFLLSAENR